MRALGGNGMVAASLITDRIQGRHNDWALVFDSTRKVTPPESGGDDEETALPGLKAVKPGEAMVVQHKGEKLAVYREKSGAMHAVAAECTHMGCLVAWNTAELSWDCPCHGSRFDIDGAVIQAPATKDLEQKDVEAS